MKITINYNDINESIEQINIISENINSSFEKIRKNCNNLTSGGYWIGQSADNFANKFAELSNNFQEIYGELKGSASYLANIVNNYQSIDKNVESRLGSKLLQNTPSLK